MNPRVLIIQQDPLNRAFLDDATIRTCLTHVGTPYVATEQNCAIERIRPDRIDMRPRGDCDVVILEYSDSSLAAVCSRIRRLQTDVPVIVVVDEKDRRAAEARFGCSDIDVVVRAADLENRLITSLVRASMRHRLLQNAQELVRAELVQKAMLPAGAPEIPGFDVAASSLPADVVGGDFYDYATTKDEHNCFLIGDVTGHGLNAALRMAEAQAYFRASLRYPGSKTLAPGSVLRRVNELLAASCSDMPLLATAMLVALSASDRSFVWAGAGHQGYLLRACGEIEPLHSTGPVMGCLEAMKFLTVGPRQLETGDAILMVTDGIAETCNRRLQLFGRDRMLDCVCRRSEETAAATLDWLFLQAQEFRGMAPQKDDMTAVLVRVVD